MRISDWSSDVCSSDLAQSCLQPCNACASHKRAAISARYRGRAWHDLATRAQLAACFFRRAQDCRRGGRAQRLRSEEHTSELQSLMRISYAVFCLKKKKNNEKKRKRSISQ